MPRRQSVSFLRALLVCAIIGAGLAIAYFLAQSAKFGTQLDFLQASNAGLVAGLCGATLLLIAASYFGNLPGARAGLETELQGHLAVARDLQTRKAKAQRARDAKSEFLAKMSHELRTPMNAVIGYSEMLLEDMIAAGKEAQSVDVKKIHGTGQVLMSLINDVLDLSKIEAGKMQIFPEEMTLGPLVTDMMSGCDELVVENANIVAFDHQESAQLVEVDKKKLRQMVGNLVGMASHVMREGVVRVTCGADAEWIHVGVANEGGIAISENAAHIFDDLDAAENSGTERNQDVVLGFSLAKQLCQLMGGVLTVEGQPGAAFRINLKIPAQPGVNAAASAVANTVAAESEDPLFALSEILSQPLQEQSPLMKACRAFYRRLFPNRDSAILAS